MALTEVSDLDPPLLDCKSFLNKCGPLIADRSSCRAANKVILENCYINILELYVLDDESVFVTLARTQGSNSFPPKFGKQIYVRLSTDTAEELLEQVDMSDAGFDQLRRLNLTFPTPVGTLTGYLVSEEYAHLAHVKTLWPDDPKISLQLDTVTAVEQEKSVEMIIFAILALLVNIIVILLAYRSLKHSKFEEAPAVNIGSIIEGRGEASNIVSLGYASTVRGSCETLSNFMLPLLLSLWTAKGNNLDVTGHLTQAIGEGKTILVAVIIFFAARLVMKEALTRAGTVICVMLFAVAVYAISQLATGWYESWEMLRKLDSVSIVMSLGITSFMWLGLGYFGAIGLRLRRWKLAGLSEHLCLLPIYRTAYKRSKKFHFRNVWLTSQIALLLASKMLLQILSGFSLGLFLYFLPRVSKWMDPRINRLGWLKRRHGALPAKDVIKNDSRPPVLLLRSFSDDDLKLPKDGGSMSRFTFEEALAHQLWCYGPVHAIGRPGESLPQSGASREYITNESWRERVIELSKQAKAIILIVHNTEGLKWELHQIVALGALKKTLFIIPPTDRDQTNQRWRGLTEDLPFWNSSKTDELPENTLVLIPACKMESLIILQGDPDVPAYDLAIDLGFGHMVSQEKENYL